MISKLFTTTTSYAIVFLASTTDAVTLTPLDGATAQHAVTFLDYAPIKANPASVQVFADRAWPFISVTDFPDDCQYMRGWQAVKNTPSSEVQWKFESDADITVFVDMWSGQEAAGFENWPDFGSYTNSCRASSVFKQGNPAQKRVYQQHFGPGTVELYGQSWNGGGNYMVFVCPGTLQPISCDPAPAPSDQWIVTPVAGATPQHDVEFIDYPELQANLATTNVFADRLHKFITLGNYPTECKFMRGSTSVKMTAGTETQWSFNTNWDATVFVEMWGGQEGAGFSHWADRGDYVDSCRESSVFIESNPRMHVYQKHYPQGQVDLGGQQWGGSGVYLVFVCPRNVAPLANPCPSNEAPSCPAGFEEVAGTSGFFTASTFTDIHDCADWCLDEEACHSFQFSLTGRVQNHNCLLNLAAVAQSPTPRDGFVMCREEAAGQVDCGADGYKLVMRQTYPFYYGSEHRKLPRNNACPDQTGCRVVDGDYECRMALRSLGLASQSPLAIGDFGLAEPAGCFVVPGAAGNLFKFNSNMSSVSKNAAYQPICRCDMTHDILNHNSNDPTSDNYSILGQLENFRMPNNELQFKFVIENFRNQVGTAYEPFEWAQTSNPVTARDQVITGYRPISNPSVAAPKPTAWGNGLRPSSRPDMCLLDGGQGSNWWYAFACYDKVPATWSDGVRGYPAFNGSQLWNELWMKCPHHHAGTNGCQTFESDLFTADDTCLGVNHFAEVDSCPQDFPTPLTKDECERLGNTARPSWALYQNPVYGGEVTSYRHGTIRLGTNGEACYWNHAQNMYVWISDENATVAQADDFALVCRQQLQPVDCSTYGRRNSCNREGSCVWVGSPQSGQCQHESDEQTCNLFSKQQCLDQRDRCLWPERVGLPRSVGCQAAHEVDCAQLTTRRDCRRARIACNWQGSCRHN